MPPGDLVDHEGVLTICPKALFEKPPCSFGPCGRHKGYEPAVMCELPCGGRTGDWAAQPGDPRSQHIVMLIVDPSAFGGLEHFQPEVKAMVD